MNKEEIRKSLLLRRSNLEDLEEQLKKDEKEFIEKFSPYKIGDSLKEYGIQEIWNIGLNHLNQFVYSDRFSHPVEEWELYTLFKYGDTFIDNLGTELFITSMWFNDVSNEVEYELCEEFCISETELKNNYKHVNKRIS